MCGAGFVLLADFGALCIAVSTSGSQSPTHGWVGLAALERFPGTPRDVILKKENPASGSAIPLFQERVFW